MHSRLKDWLRTLLVFQVKLAQVLPPAVPGLEGSRTLLTSYRSVFKMLCLNMSPKISDMNVFQHWAKPT